MFGRTPHIRSKRKMRRSRRNIWLFGWAIFFGLGILVAGLVYITETTAKSRGDVVIIADTSVDSKELRHVVQSVFTEKIAFFLSSANALWLPHESLHRSLTERYPDIGSISMRRLESGRIAVRIGERKKFALWCRKEQERDVPQQAMVVHVGANSIATSTPFTPPQEAFSDCYYMTEKGLIFEKAPVFRGSSFVTYITEVRADDPRGAVAMDSTTFLRVTDFVAKIKLLDMRVQSVRLEKDNLTFSLSPSGAILVNKAQDFDDVHSRLLAIIRNDEFRDSVKSVARDLDYIDLRFGNKIFYKMRE
jgi:hypothetical protein